MSENRRLVEQARAGDDSAFANLVQQNQSWVLGCAAALLGDYHLAQDVVQDAFAAAHASLPTLADPDAFSGWLKAIVRHSCFRVLRRNRLDLVPLDLASDEPAGEPGPDWFAEAEEKRREVLSALETLSEDQRQIVLLHYWHEYSHREIAAFLGLPLTTVNNRLHAARTRLRQEMLVMTDNAKEETARSSEARGFTVSGRSGDVIATYGPVADVQFASNDLPPLRSWLVPARGTAEGGSLLSVVAYLGNGIVRAVATESKFKPRNGMTLIPASPEIAAPIDWHNAREAVAQFVRLAHERPSTGIRIDTGIKVLDLFCPLVDGDVVGFAVRPGLGQMVLIQELLYRRGTRPGHFALVAPIPIKDPVYALGDAYGIGDVQTAYLPLQDIASPPAGFLDPVDVTIELSLPLAKLGMWPTVDPNVSSSRHLDPSVVGAEHVDTVARVRQLLRRFPPEHEGADDQAILSEEDRILIARSRRLRRFLSQPMYVAEPWIRWSAEFVPVADTIRGCRAILDGACDTIREDAFYMANTIEKVIERGGGT